jgi:excinuclease UvrABC helicase subunit UvrB
LESPIVFISAEKANWKLANVMRKSKNIVWNVLRQTYLAWPPTEIKPDKKLIPVYDHQEMKQQL